MRRSEARRYKCGVVTFVMEAHSRVKIMNQKMWGLRWSLISFIIPLILGSFIVFYNIITNEDIKNVYLFSFVISITITGVVVIPLGIVSIINLKIEWKIYSKNEKKRNSIIVITIFIFNLCYICFAQYYLWNYIFTINL